MDIAAAPKTGAAMTHYDIHRQYTMIVRYLMISFRSTGIYEKTSNADQWSLIPLLEDIEGYRTGLCSLVNRKGTPDAGEIEGVFFAQNFPEPTYDKIDGEWIDDKQSYITIHRIASRGRKSGISDAAFAWCKERADSVRVDTHRLNVPMIRAIERNGFTYCGIIIIADGTPRLAYQWRGAA